MKITHHYLPQIIIAVVHNILVVNIHAWKGKLILYFKS